VLVDGNVLYSKTLRDWLGLCYLYPGGFPTKSIRRTVSSAFSMTHLPNRYKRSLKNNLSTG
jgi:hypothetical protein